MPIIYLALSATVLLRRMLDSSFEVFSSMRAYLHDAALAAYLGGMVEAAVSEIIRTRMWGQKRSVYITSSSSSSTVLINRVSKVHDDILSLFWRSWGSCQRHILRKSWRLLWNLWSVNCVQKRKEQKWEKFVGDFIVRFELLVSAVIRRRPIVIFTRDFGGEQWAYSDILYKFEV